MNAAPALDLDLHTPAQAPQVEPARRPGSVRPLPRYALLPGVASTSGYAPDLVWGKRSLDTLYLLEAPQRLERTLFVAALDDADDNTLLTLGRFEDGFLHVVQIVLDAADRALDAAVEPLLEGVVRVVTPAQADLAHLLHRLASAERHDLARALTLAAPVSLRELVGDTLAAEQRLLGLERNQELNTGALQRLFFDACRLYRPDAARFLLDLGRCDLLGAVALHTEALARLHGEPALGAREL